MRDRSPDVSVVIPTYREAESLPALVPRIAVALAQSGLDGEVIVVDDDSRDGTDEVYERLSHSQNCRLRLITRRDERGLSSAVVCGLRAARGAVLVVMDADLSHPPESIPTLVDAVKSPLVDFAIGSRYVDGGSVDASWSWFRRLNSRAATLLARGITSARDPMAGFFAIKRTTFEQATAIQPLGYKIGLELIVRCECRRIVEIPIAFVDRVHGESKLSLRQQGLYIRHLGRLYAAKYAALAQVIRFCLVGLSGMALDVGALVALLPLAPLTAARIVAIWLAMTWNFLWHRRVTFPAAAPGGLLARYASFCGACLLGAGMNFMASLALCASNPWFSERPALAAAVGALTGAAANFLLCKRWVFRQSTVAGVSGADAPTLAPAQPIATSRQAA